MEETLPFAAPLVNLFQPQLFPPYVPREGIVKKPFMERYAEALICGEVEVDKLLKEYPDMAEAINKLDMPTKPKVD